jgi:hypothetical protein
MLGSGKTGAGRALVTASPARGPGADLYRRYAAGVYRHALLTGAGPARQARRPLRDINVADPLTSRRK